MREVTTVSDEPGLESTALNRTGGRVQSVQISSVNYRSVNRQVHCNCGGDSCLLSLLAIFAVVGRVCFQHQDWMCCEVLPGSRLHSSRLPVSASVCSSLCPIKGCRLSVRFLSADKCTSREIRARATPNAPPFRSRPARPTRAFASLLKFTLIV